jgi:hypothetical protein
MGNPSVTDDRTFPGMVLEVTHDAFMASTWLFTALTLFIVGVALYRLVPRRLVNPIAPDDSAPVKEDVAHEPRP